MERVIKFRAWDKTKNKMLYGDNIKLTWMMTEQSILNDVFKDESMAFMQFTGFHDKNGKEIYDGDIVKIKSFFPCVGVVKYGFHKLFNEGGCCEIEALGFYVEGKKIGEFIEPENEYRFSDIEEVLGNIFENPELLGEGDGNAK